MDRFSSRNMVMSKDVHIVHCKLYRVKYISRKHRCPAATVTVPWESVSLLLQCWGPEPVGATHKYL